MFLAIVKIREGSSKGRILTEFTISEMNWKKNGESYRKEILILPFKKIAGKIDLFIEAYPISEIYSTLFRCNRI